MTTAAPTVQIMPKRTSKGLARYSTDTILQAPRYVPSSGHIVMPPETVEHREPHQGTARGSEKTDLSGTCDTSLPTSRGFPTGPS